MVGKGGDRTVMVPTGDDSHQDSRGRKQSRSPFLSTSGTRASSRRTSRSHTSCWEMRNSPSGCLTASEELARRATNYGTIADVMFYSTMHPLAPENERAPLLTKHITIAAEASLRAITASVAVAANIQLVQRDVVLDHLLFQQLMVPWVHTAPFMGIQLHGA